jgi:predicted phage terminase large subunit-like protein
VNRDEIAELLPYLSPDELAELDALLRDGPPSLQQFVEGTTGFALEPWQQIVANRLEQLVDQTGQRILIHGPPQYGKSIVISQRFPAYAIGRKPTHRLRVACYNVTHAERFSKVNLDLMRDPAYLQMFPDAGARVPAVCPSDEWSTAARAGKRDANPSFKALGLGTGFTGMGVDILVIDDPYKGAQEARSQAVNTALWDWWTQVVQPRLNPATNIVVMFHRWWEGDFAGRLIEQGGWELMRFPAIADGKGNDPTGRKEGELLSPRYPRAYLADLARKMGTAFDALYQGTPTRADGNLFKAGKVKYLSATPESDVLARVRRWDIAATEGGGDYTVGLLMAYIEPGIFVVEDVVRGQWGPDERNATIKETARRDRQRYGSVLQLFPQDPGSAGVDVAQSFVRLLAGHTVETERESGDKEVRADPAVSQWNGGNFALVEGEWNGAYVAEMLAFPNGKYDDQVDTTSGALNRLVELAESGEGDDPFEDYRG